MKDKNTLQKKRCTPCEGRTPPLKPEDIDKYLEEISKGWIQKDYKKIEKLYRFSNFKQSVTFMNDIADLAEEEGHHPNMCIMFSNVKVSLSTHAIGGLSENDFIMAAKIDRVSDKKSEKKYGKDTQK